MPKISILDRNTILYRRHQLPELFNFSITKALPRDNWHPAAYFHVLGPSKGRHVVPAAYDDISHPYSFVVITTKDILCIDYRNDDMDRINFYDEDSMEEQFEIIRQLIRKRKGYCKPHTRGANDFIHWLGANGYAYIGPEGNDLTEVAFPFSFSLENYIRIYRNRL